MESTSVSCGLPPQPSLEKNRLRMALPTEPRWVAKRKKRIQEALPVSGGKKKPGGLLSEWVCWTMDGGGRSWWCTGLRGPYHPWDWFFENRSMNGWFLWDKCSIGKYTNPMDPLGWRQRMGCGLRGLHVWLDGWNGNFVEIRRWSTS